MTQRSFTIIISIVIGLTVIFVPYLIGHYIVHVEAVRMKWFLEWFMGVTVSFLAVTGIYWLGLSIKFFGTLIIDWLDEVSDKLYPFYQRILVLKDYLQLRSKYSKSTDDDDTIEPMYMRDNE